MAKQHRANKGIDWNMPRERNEADKKETHQRWKDSPIAGPKSVETNSCVEEEAGDTEFKEDLQWFIVGVIDSPEGGVGGN